MNSLMKTFRSWDPFKQLEAWTREMDRLWDGFGSGSRRAYPPVNLWVSDDSARVTLIAPGVESKDLEVSIEGDLLTVRGRFNPETASDADTPHLQERYHGEFARAVRLPVPVDPEKVEARFENGILQVTLQKAEEALPRKIKVS